MDQIITGIPNTHLFMFAGGFIAGVAGLAIMQIRKRNKYNHYDDED